MKTMFAAFAAAAMTTLTVGAAYAEPVKVAYGDLDLRSPAGVATFKARAQAAAKDVCGSPSGGIQGEANVSACRRDTVAKAMNDIAFRTTPAYASR